VIRRGQRDAVLALLTTAVLATVATLLATDDEPMIRVTLLLVAFVAVASLAYIPELRAALTVRAVVVATLVVTTVAVALPSQQSQDLWSYAMDGRIVAHYGDSPYVHPPNHYPHDPLLQLVGSGWRGTRTVYGPLFTGLSAAIMGVTGTNRLPTRMAFQLLAALAVLATMLLLYRRTRDPVALLLVGVNPVVALEVINPGRNDALVGLAILAGVLLAGRRRLVAAAVLVAVAALVKVAALAALGGLLLWVVWRYGARLALRAGAAAGALFVGAYALAGGTRALQPVADASDRLSRASVWQLVRTDGIQHLLVAAPAEPVRRVIAVVGPLALVAVVGLGLFFAVSRLADPTPELVVAGAVVAFLLAGSYVLASYVAWVLPILAWRHRAGISRLVLLWSAFLLLSYQAGRGLPPDGDDIVPWLMSFVALFFAAGAITMLSMAATRRIRTLGRRSEETAVPKLAP
jgi:alpha-1,6-mannosyltransferase